MSVSAECRGATLVRCQRFLAGCGRTEHTVYSVSGVGKNKVILEQHRWDFQTVLPINSSYIKFKTRTLLTSNTDLLFLFYIFPLRNYRGAKSLMAKVIRNQQIASFIWIHVVWLARLIKPYYPACLIATASVPLSPPPLTAERDVYSGNHWQVERRMALMARSFAQWNVFISFLSPVFGFSDEQLLGSPWKTRLFQISRDGKKETNKWVLLHIYCRGQLHFMCLNVAALALLGWHVWDMFVNFTVREREYRVLDRHSKGIRQMCCCVWVDQALGFYCCFSRGPLGFLNLPVKFWESQRKSATFLCH